jgi:hypothetical protein
MHTVARTISLARALACGLAIGGAAAHGVEIPVAYESPGDGLLSLVLHDDQGTIVRSLLSAEPVKAGTGKVEWDGTDDLGRVCKPGEYAVRGLFFDKAPALEYRMTVGRSGNPAYRTPDGKGSWGANLGGGTGIATNKDSVMMVFACVEDSMITGLQRVDLEGNILRRYFSFYPWDQRTSAAMDDKNIYVAIYANEKLELAAYTLDESRGKILAALPVKPTVTQHGRWRNRPVAYTEGMALSESTVYVSVPHDDALFLVGRGDGKVTRIDLPAPRGLAFHDGKLFTVSGRKVLRLSAEGKVEATLVDGGGLEHPSSLAVDAKGNLYVGDSGADVYAAGTLVGGDRLAKGGTRQIHVFSRDGKPLRRVGRAGGSPPEGRFKEDGFGEISGIAVDSQGRLWVNDIATGFKRNSLWSADGTLLEQWFCRKVQHTADIVNPANPRELLSIRGIFDDSPPGIFAYEVDFAKGSWKPSWFYELTVERAYAPAAGGYQSFTHGGFPMEKAYPEKQGRWPAFGFSDSLAAIDGRLCMLQSSGNGEGAIHLVTPDAPPRPVALIGYHHLQEKNEAGEWLANYDKAGPNRWMTWADRNGDGTMQPDEMRITENDPALEPFRRVYEAGFRPDGSVALSMVGSGGFVEATLAPREWLAGGVPVFDWSDLKISAAARAMPDFSGGDGIKKPGVIRAIGSAEKDGVHYALLEPGAPAGLRLPGIDGDGWWASRNWRKKLAAWNADGTLAWAVGRRAPARAKRGEMYNPMGLSGVARDCVFLSDAMSMTWVWHKDGFYVGRLFPDTGTGVMDDTGIYVEMMGNRIREEGGRLYTLVNDTACAVHEVILPTFQPVAAAPVRLSPDDASRARPWDPDGPDPSVRPTFTAVRHDPTRVGATPMKLDGEADGREGWYEGKRDPMLILLDGERLADIRAMYDTKHLYLHYKIFTPTRFANAGTELPLAPFVSGGYADFCVGPDWTRPRREQPAAGDVRVILARMGAKPDDFSQGYWPVMPGAGGPPTVIRSPAAEATFDRIGPVEGLAMAWKDKGFDERSKLHRTTLEVHVPLAALGITGDPAGRSIGFDASVAVANEGGDRRERAMHWAGLSEGVVVDRPGSALLLPRTWGTMTFINDKK